MCVERNVFIDITINQINSGTDTPDVQFRIIFQEYVGARENVTETSSHILVTGQ